MTKVVFLRKDASFHIHAGSSGPGPKSASLLKDSDLFDYCKLPVPNSASLSYSIFKEYIDRCGAAKASEYHESKRLIREGVFSEEERARLAYILSFFPSDQRYRLMVRSDDYGAGLGLSSSGPAFIIPSTDKAKNQKRIIDAVERQIKEVLASDFCPESQEFKRKKWLSPISGVLIMPIEGQAIAYNRELFISPIFSINMLGLPDSPALFSLGAGLGGANLKHALVRTCQDPPFLEFLGDRKLIDSDWQGLSMADGSLKKLSLSRQLQTMHNFLDVDCINKSLRALSESLREFLALAGRRYMELVLVCDPLPRLSVVQSSTFQYSPFQWPQIEESRVMLRTTRVTGTCSLTTNGVRFAGSIPTEEDFRYNETHKDYMLVVSSGENDATMASTFRHFWKLPSFSNAGAIVLVVFDIQNHTISHLNGLYREMGIPVLIVKKSELGENYKSVRKRTQSHDGLRLQVYSDEFRSEGIACL